MKFRPSLRRPIEPAGSALRSGGPSISWLSSFAGLCVLSTVVGWNATLTAAGAQAADWVAFPKSVREIPAAQSQGLSGAPSIVRTALRSDEMAASVTFEVALRMRNFAEFQTRVAQGEKIAAGELAQKYTPLSTDEDRVVAWIKSQGLTVIRTDANHLAVFGQGSVAAVQQAFRTSFARVAVAGVEYTSAVTAPSLPSDVASPVLGIHGLQRHIRPHPLLRSAPIPVNPSASGGTVSYLPAQIAAAYHATGLGTGSGQTIAIYDGAYPATSDLSAFWSSAGVSQTTSNVKQININSGPGSSPDSSYVLEASLDVEWAGALAPAAQIRIYGADINDATSFDQTCLQVLTDLPANPGLHQFSLSLGWNESQVDTDYLVIEAQLMASLANAGVTVFAATGDGGSNPDPSTGQYNPHSPIDVLYPASDPSVTAVGGTTLQLASNGSVTSETAWSGSGGGYSSYFPRPAWQTSLTGFSGTTRMIPDVSATADPSFGGAVTTGGKTTIVGGTSWATPVWAAFGALINEARAKAGSASLGLFNPRLYAAVASGSVQLRDVTAGNNVAYQALTGFDLCTGLGVPDVTALAKATLSSTGAPLLTAQLGDTATVLGQPATFAVAADGQATLAYQWQRLPVGTSTWANLTNSTTYQGSSAAALVVSNTTIAMSGDSFRCVVSNGAGSATSTASKLTVNYDGVTTLAGWPGAAQWLDGMGSAARFAWVGSVRTDSAGNIYVGDGTNTVRKVTPTGVVTTIAGIANVAGSADGAAASATFNGIGGVAVDSNSGTIYVADSENYTIRKITSAGVVSTLAGSAGNTGTADGTGSAARFFDPENLAVDAAGNIWVADGAGYTIRKVTPAGVVTTFAGQAGVAGSADGTGTLAKFNTLGGVVVDGSGNLYVGDAGNNEVRKITPSGVVTTLAGSASAAAANVDGTGSAARFNAPTGLAVDSSGNVFVADTGNATIRKITPAGVVTTIAGKAGQTGSVNGLAAAAVFTEPDDIAIGPPGIIYVADSGNFTVRRIALTQVAPYMSGQPSSAVVGPGQSASFMVQISGSGPITYQWQVSADGGSTWSNLSDGSAYSGTLTTTLSVSSATSSMNGEQLRCVGTNAYGSIVSSAVTLTVDPNAATSRLANISTRSFVGTGDQVQIAGFIINGTVAKKVLIRASGPALTQYGVSGVLADPTITLYSGSNIIGQNDDWGSDANVPAYTAASGATAFAAGSKDSAIAATLSPGAYTAIVSGKNSGTGVSLVEVFEADGTSSSSKLVNISTRSQALTSDQVQIAGFIVSGTNPKKLLIRASGPALTQYGISGVLADPTLTLYSGSNVIGQNDDWGTDVNVPAFTTGAGATPFAAGSKDSALAVTLQPGAYTAIVSGKNSGTGTALIEVFEVP